MILVSGEALIDLFIGAPGLAGFPAEAIAEGSPFNVAIGMDLSQEFVSEFQLSFPRSRQRRAACSRAGILIVR